VGEIPTPSATTVSSPLEVRDDWKGRDDRSAKKRKRGGQRGGSGRSGKKKKKNKPKTIGGGAQKQREVSGPPPFIAKLYALEEPIALDKNGLIPFRTNDIYNHYSDGRMCATDAGNSAVGEHLARPTNVKRARFARTKNPSADCAVADFSWVVRSEKHPFSFPIKKQLTWKTLISEVRQGIYICRLNFIDGVTGKLDKHFLVVDCWRQIVLDNAEKYPIPFAGMTPKQLMKRLECARYEKIHQCMVLASRVEETKYV